MKTIITSAISLLLFVAAVMALAWLLPLWATLGIILLLQFFCLALFGLTLKQRNDYGKEE